MAYHDLAEVCAPRVLQFNFVSVLQQNVVQCRKYVKLVIFHQRGDLWKTQPYMGIYYRRVTGSDDDNTTTSIIVNDLVLQPITNRSQLDDSGSTAGSQ